jgi:hypothetical protein
MHELRACKLKPDGAVIRQQRRDTIDVALLDPVAAVANKGSDQLPRRGAPSMAFFTMNLEMIAVASG